MTTKKHSLPQLPLRLHAATLASAENLAAIAHSEGIELGDKDGVSTPHLHTILYLMRDRCIEAELELQPWLGDKWIELSEIATVLETLGHMIVSEGLDELAGHNASWYMDAARVIELTAQDKGES